MQFLLFPFCAHYKTFLSDKSPASHRLPSSIPVDQMRVILSAQDDEEDKDLLLTWYQLAEESEGGEYELNAKQESDPGGEQVRALASTDESYNMRGS